MTNESISQPVQLSQRQHQQHHDSQQKASTSSTTPILIPLSKPPNDGHQAGVDQGRHSIRGSRPSGIEDPDCCSSRRFDGYHSCSHYFNRVWQLLWWIL